MAQQNQQLARNDGASFLEQALVTNGRRGKARTQSRAIDHRHSELRGRYEKVPVLGRQNEISSLAFGGHDSHYCLICRRWWSGRTVVFYDLDFTPAGCILNNPNELLPFVMVAPFEFTQDGSRNYETNARPSLCKD